MNYLLAVMEAVTNSVGAINQQELVDGGSTTLDTKIEQNEYNTWTSKVKAGAALVQKYAGYLANQNGTHSKTYNTNKLVSAQADFQNLETEEQTYTQQSDGATQAMQNQTGQDSSNAQSKVQLESAVNQVAQTLSSALAQSY